MSGSRPRRSTKNANYNAAKIFADLMGEPQDGVDANNGADGSAHDPMQPEASISTAHPSGSQKGKRRAPDSDSETEGSNFDPQENPEPQVEEEDEYVSEGAEESDEGDTNAPATKAEASDDDSSVIDMAVRPKKHIANRVVAAASSKPKPKRALSASKSFVQPVITHGVASTGRKTLRSKSGGERFWTSVLASKDDTKPKAPANKKNQPWEEAFGMEGPEIEYMALSEPAATPIHTRSAHPEAASRLEDVGIMQFKCAVENIGRMNLTGAWRATPFAPVSMLCQDVGWYKGKFTNPERWGGWYGRNQAPEAVEGLSYTEAKQYFPWESQAKNPNEEDTMQAEIAEGQRQEEAEDFKEADSSQRQLPRGSVPLWIGPGLPGVSSSDANNNGEGPKRQQYFAMERFTSMRLDHTLPRKPGHVFNAGGPVWTLDWCPQPDVLHPATKEYLAVGTLTDQPAVGAFAQTAFSTNPPRLRGFVQLWSLDVSRAEEMRRDTSGYVNPPTMVFEGGLCVDVGEPWCLKWCPRGGYAEDPESNSLGILAGVFTDGCIHFFDVPRPKSEEPEYLHVQPVLSLKVPDSSMVCFDWASHERVVAGCENGHIVVWDVGQALAAQHGPPAKLQPTYYIPAHEGSVRQVTVLRNPPSDGLDLKHNDQEEPFMVGSSGTDGSQVLLDLRDQRTTGSAVHTRALGLSNTFNSFLGTFTMSDADDGVSIVQVRPQACGLTRKIYQHQGAVWNLACSSFHPFTASASADGTSRVCNDIRKVASKHHTCYTWIVFRMDYNRRTGEYRMVDNLPPESHSSSANSSVDQATKTKRAKGQGSGSEEQPPPSAAWLPEVAAQCVSWGKSLHRPCFLATGTHSGLVRVDWVEGPLDQYAADFGVLTALGSRAWGQHQQPVVVVE